MVFSWCILFKMSFFICLRSRGLRLFVGEWSSLRPALPPRSQRCMSHRKTHAHTLITLALFQKSIEEHRLSLSYTKTNIHTSGVHLPRGLLALFKPNSAIMCWHVWHTPFPLFPLFCLPPPPFPYIILLHLISWNSLWTHMQNNQCAISLKWKIDSVWKKS